MCHQRLLNETVPIGASSHGQQWPLNDDAGNEGKGSNRMTLLVISIERKLTGDKHWPHGAYSRCTRPPFVLNGRRGIERRLLNAQMLTAFLLSVLSFSEHSEECSTLGNVFICLAAVIFSSPSGCATFDGVI